MQKLNHIVLHFQHFVKVETVAEVNAVLSVCGSSLAPVSSLLQT